MWIVYTIISVNIAAALAAAFVGNAISGPVLRLMGLIVGGPVISLIGLIAVKWWRGSH